MTNQLLLNEIAKEMIALRKRIHVLEGHNQYFERCESAWCNPTEKDNPALGTLNGLVFDEKARSMRQDLQDILSNVNTARLEYDDTTSLDNIETLVKKILSERTS